MGPSSGRLTCPLPWWLCSCWRKHEQTQHGERSAVQQQCFQLLDTRNWELPEVTGLHSWGSKNWCLTSGSGLWIINASRLSVPLGFQELHFILTYPSDWWGMSLLVFFIVFSFHERSESSGQHRQRGNCLKKKTEASDKADEWNSIKLEKFHFLKESMERMQNSSESEKLYCHCVADKRAACIWNAERIPTDN